jgi:acetate kinase
MNGRAMRVLVFNAGTATLKVALVEVGSTTSRVLQREEVAWPDHTSAAVLVDELLARFESAADLHAHRVVHGARQLVETVRADTQVEATIESLVSLAPLHNARSLDVMRRLRERRPEIPAYAAFDTAFHRSMPESAARYALPEELAERFGFRRYGFHGLAHASLVRAAAQVLGLPSAAVTAVTLQLGSGCSACAVRHGESVETSMGYSPLEGLVMATRCGDLDPAVVIALARAGLDPDRIEAMLNRESGLLGIAGESDMRKVLAAARQGEATAELALDMFVRRLVSTIGAYLTQLNGEGALVFGGGIGSRSAQIRSRVAGALSCWGVQLDPDRNREGNGLVSMPGSRPVLALETDEESLIAADVVSVFRRS